MIDTAGVHAASTNLQQVERFDDLFGAVGWRARVGHNRYAVVSRNGDAVPASELRVQSCNAANLSELDA